MIRTQQILQSPQVSLARIDHDPCLAHHDPKEEVCSEYAVNFVERGSFSFAFEDSRWNLSDGCVFLSRPGAVHRYEHQEQFPADVCLSVIFSKESVTPSFEEDPSLDRALPTVARPTNRLAFLKLRLLELADDNYQFGMDTLALELLSALREPNAKQLYRERQLRWYAERVQAGREILDAHYAEPHSLFALARSVGMSTFQFARIFSELQGVAPHQYLLRVRLEKAAGMLRDGAPVTQCCFDAGFSNLSHFTRSFRKRFGCVPSQFRVRACKEI
jgi:AraC family transcriptional regulator